MKKLMRRVLSLVLMMAMLVPFVPGRQAFASEFSEETIAIPEETEVLSQETDVVEEAEIIGSIQRDSAATVAACSHSYRSFVSTVPTCTGKGVKTFLCDLCQASYTQSVAALGHSYSGGLCINCGSADPSRVDTSRTFYLFGFINGSNYGCEEDSANLGSYRFDSTGSCTVTFLSDSYVGVKTGDNATWLMTDGWQGTDACQVKLYHTASIGSRADKLYIPGGIRVRFTLITNGDGSYSLSYRQVACNHTFTNAVTKKASCLAEGVRTYTCSDCGHYYLESIAALGHNFQSNKCTRCGEFAPGYCEHDYTSKVTKEANCTSNGVRTYTCRYCASSYTESIPAGGHSYSSKVTTVATCTETGVMTYTCSGCTASYTRSIAATGHSYSGGKCIRCGDADPSIAAETYYLFGYINGTNYACEESHQNLGVYKFVDGKLTATFTSDSYVGVKTSDNQKWYLTNGWLGKDVTGATLYESSTLSNADKLYVPGNVEVTFTLTKNSNNTMKLSYTVATCIHNYAGGVCLNCGSKDPNAGSQGADYYLFGYINGYDYASQMDAGNVGSYKFVNGKLTTTFTCGSYVAVKTADNATWFMTNGWQGTNKTSVKLYETRSLTRADKLFVPGNVQVTFTLVENSDGSLTLSYTTTGNGYSGSAVKPSFSLKYPTVSFEDTIVLNVYYAATNIQDAEEIGLVTFDSKISNYNINTADYVVPGYTWSEANGYYCSSSAGIAAKNLGDTIYFAVYARLKDGTYTYSSLVSYSPKTYAYNLLKTGSDEMKALVVAMLNYGAQAQSYFGYKTGSLVNADLTSAQKALVSSYSASMMNTVATPAASKLSVMVNNGGYASLYPTISFEGVFCINYYFKPSAVPVGNITMYVWNQDDYQSVSTLRKNNATMAINMTKTSSDEYVAVVDGIAAKDLDKGVYVSFCYSDGTTDYCSGVVGYSIGTYCTSQAAKTGSLANLAASCAVYGYYAKQMFR